MLAWTRWWNTEHRPRALAGRTPLEAWQADPTPVTDVPAADLWTFTLEDDGRPRKLSSHGVRWRGRTYIAPWMTGQAGRTVTVRYMPHHDHEIDVCDARGTYLGPCGSGPPSGGPLPQLQHRNDSRIQQKPLDAVIRSDSRAAGAEQGTG
ncbi:Mu transposase C-terminal domain-containing protein [Streptomyces sp. NPDC102405]|uniref:Mu transposase C-terminal domain-containing protein n=1 Tax=Streptomyces sp. NPDC102405 TaxID=3366170 RepID=UPI0038283D18